MIKSKQTLNNKKLLKKDMNNDSSSSSSSDDSSEEDYSSSSDSEIETKKKSKSTITKTTKTTTTTTNKQTDKKVEKDKKDKKEDIVYYGELKCMSSKKKCDNKSYFCVKFKNASGINNETLYLCGVHSKAYKSLAHPLPKRSKESKEQHQEELMEIERVKIEKARKENHAKSQPGRCVLSALKMMKAPEQIDGFLKVFPNNKHGGRKDGMGMPSLSPMRLGPVNTGQPNAPAALNIENFHQGSKCYARDLEKDGTVGKIFLASRDKMYTDAEPHRHKYGRGVKPEFFVWYTQNTGEEKRLDALQCRQFYCNYYERLASVTDDFVKLKELHRNGTNIQIIGYDARRVESDEKSIMNAYKDTRFPFGHELVIFAMLMIEDPSKYPWRILKSFEF